jgi:hypothetical protein
MNDLADDLTRPSEIENICQRNPSGPKHVTRYLGREKRVRQASPDGYRGVSLDRDDLFVSALARIEEERHSRLPREPIRFD